MEWFTLFRMKAEGCLYFVGYEVQVGPCRTKENFGARLAVAQYLPPLFNQGRLVVIGQPILVVQEYKVGVPAGMPPQKFGNCTGVMSNASGTRLQAVQVFGF
jgi:hypothetical protein